MKDKILIPAPILSLDMDEIFQGQGEGSGPHRITNDLSGTGKIADVFGAVEVVPDETFGAAFRFNGIDGKVQVDNWNPPSEYSISLWLTADLGPNYGLPLNLFASDVAEGHEEEGWHHVVWSFSKGSPKLYADGTEISLSESPVMALPENLELGVGFEGKLACIRIFDEELDLAQVREMAARDQIAGSTFNYEYPLDFQFLDDEVANILYISDASDANIFTLEIANRTDKDLYFLGRSGDEVPSARKYHLGLRFKSSTFLKKLPGKDDNSLKEAIRAYGNWPSGWVCSSASYEKDGGLSLYLEFQDEINSEKIPVGETMRFSFEYQSADGAGGARSSSVVLLYKDLTFENPDANASETSAVKGYLEGQRIRPMDIVNQRGKRSIPLRVGFVGANRILNDGKTESELTIRILNTMEKGELVFSQDDVNNDRETAFKLYFDDPAGEAWDFASLEDLKEIKVKVGSTEIDNVADQGQSPVYLIKPGMPSLGGQKYIEFTISGIISDTPTGLAYLTLSYEDVPGYWDGKFLLEVEKSPMVFWNKRVGIGITEPETDLHLVGNVTIEGTTIFKGSVEAEDGVKMGAALRFANNNWVNEEGHNLTLGSGEKRILTLTPDGKLGLNNPHPAYLLDVNGDISLSGKLRLNENSWIKDDGRLLIGRDADTHIIVAENGKVGIGNFFPEEKLSVKGNVQVDGELVIKGGNKIKTTLRNSLEISAHNKTNQLFLHKWGFVGIGTDSPTDKLEVNGNIRAKGYYIEDIFLSKNELEILKQLVPYLGKIKDLFESKVSMKVYNTSSTKYVHTGKTYKEVEIRS